MADIQHGERAHAKLSASGAERWMNCPASVSLSEQAPPVPESQYAKEGTTAHECLEFLLRNRAKLKAATKMALKKYTEEMVEHALEAVRYIMKRCDELDSPEVLIETKVDLSFVDDDMFGTLDVSIIERGKKLVVIDYKYGAGYVVEPDNNPQLIYYALGIAHTRKFKFKEVELVVIQPRAYHESGNTIRTWATTVDDLKRWQWAFTDAVEDTKAKAPRVQSGSWCKFCPAAVICPELSNRALTDARIAFDDDMTLTSIPAPSKIAIPDLGRILNACDKLEAWIQGVRAHAFDVLKRGERVKGWKLVEKRATRKYKDLAAAEVEARKLFGDMVFSEPYLISPAQLEKKCRNVSKHTAKFLKKHTTSESTGVTIAPKDDRRPAVNPAKDVFPDDL